LGIIDLIKFELNILYLQLNAKLNQSSNIADK